jgi:ArsR family transcriptional regulator
VRDPLQSNLCSKYLRAVADPERLRIVQCLRTGAKSVGEIAQHLDAPVVNASHHLKHLRRAGLVSAEKQGRFVYYALAPRFAPAGAGGTLDVLDFGCCRIELGQGPGRRR